jgi:hypothetical protein
MTVGPACGTHEPELAQTSSPSQQSYLLLLAVTSETPDPKGYKKATGLSAATTNLQPEFNKTPGLLFEPGAKPWLERQEASGERS